MSLSETYLSRKKLLADNLKSMGVSSVNETDGLTTLINAVLNIEPSIGGLNLDTSLVITTTQEIIGLGESIILTSTLRASYDDTTVVDVDLSGVLTGATVKFYNGTTLLGTGITDLNGVATYTYTPSQLGNFTFHTVFEGTENFTNCTSNNVNITVINAPTSLVLEADKSILSHYDNDNCTLTATLLDSNNNGVSGEEIVFKANGGVLGTVITGDNGVAQCTYQSTGVGDVTITAEGMNLTKTLGIEDCIIANVNASYTGTSTSDKVYSLGYDEIADLSSIDFEFSFKFHQTGYGCDVCLGASSEFSVSPIKSNYRIFIGNSGSGNTRYGYRITDTINSGGSTSGEVSLNTTHNMKIVKEGTLFKYYLNDRLLGSKTITGFWFDYHMFGVHTVQWNRGTTTISDLKIKQI